MAEISTDYRYHPESKDTALLCKLLEEKAPNAHFGHSYVYEKISKKSFIQMEAWNEEGTKYYSQLLRDHHAPEDIVDKFMKVLGIKPKSLLWLPGQPM